LGVAQAEKFRYPGRVLSGQYRKRIGAVFRQWAASVRTATHLLARRPTPRGKLPPGKTSHFVSLRIDPSHLNCNLRRSAPISHGSGTKKMHGSLHQFRVLQYQGGQTSLLAFSGKDRVGKGFEQTHRVTSCYGSFVACLPDDPSDAAVALVSPERTPGAPLVGNHF